jgi:uncharacterized protein (TIGR00730 family)
MESICVFCGSSEGARPLYRETAQEMGRTIARRGLRLVYGGGRIGLMGTLADAALAAGGAVTGVIPRSLADKEIAHPGLTDLRLTGSMHERKALMAEMADAFIALPGGWGTFDELCEILTWAQIGLHAKPCGLLNPAGYYDPLLALFDRAVEERFLRPEHRAMLRVETDPDLLLEALSRYRAPLTPKYPTVGQS